MSPQISSATTLFVSNLSCWTKYLLNVSFLSPAILSQVLPSSLCLAYTTIPPTCSHPPRKHFVSVLPLIYKSTCSPGLLLSLISLSLSSPQRKHLCSLSTIQARFWSRCFSVGLPHGWFACDALLPSYMRLGIRFNPFPPHWMTHHDVKAQTGF